MVDNILGPVKFIVTFLKKQMCAICKQTEEMAIASGTFVLQQHPGTADVGEFFDGDQEVPSGARAAVDSPQNYTKIEDVDVNVESNIDYSAWQIEGTHNATVVTTQQTRPSEDGFGTFTSENASSESEGSDSFERDREEQKATSSIDAVLAKSSIDINAEGSHNADDGGPVSTLLEDGSRNGVNTMMKKNRFSRKSAGFNKNNTIDPDDAASDEVSPHGSGSNNFLNIYVSKTFSHMRLTCCEHCVGLLNAKGRFDTTSKFLQEGVGESPMHNLSFQSSPMRDSRRISLNSSGLNSNAASNEWVKLEEIESAHSSPKIAAPKFSEKTPFYGVDRNISSSGLNRSSNMNTMVEPGAEPSLVEFDHGDGKYSSPKNNISRDSTRINSGSTYNNSSFVSQTGTLAIDEDTQQYHESPSKRNWRTSELI